MVHNIVSRDNLSISALTTQGVDVTLSNVSIGAAVRRGRHWNSRKWRDDIDVKSELRPKPRVTGQIIGFTDAFGTLVGANSGRDFETDRITPTNGAGWAVVKWETNKISTYPIGAQDLFCLKFID